ncbi:MAG: hypothetical protein ACKPIB_27075 [Dolichospermum sp.]
MRSLFSSLLPSCSSRLRGLLKKDIGELRGCDRFWDFEGSAISLSLCPLCLCGSLKKDVWEVGGGAIALSLCLCGSLKKECLGS